MIRIDKGHSKSYHGLQEATLYICLCHGITDKQIRTCIREGARDMSDLRGRLGVATQCGSCEHQALEILDEALRPAASCAAPCASSSAPSFITAGTLQAA